MGNHQTKAMKAEKEARLKAEAEARKKAEEEAEIEARREKFIEAEVDAMLLAEAKAEEETKIQAEILARFEARKAKKKAEEEAQLKAEEEAKKKAEEEDRLKAEAEAKKKAEEEVRLKAEAEAAAINREISYLQWLRDNDRRRYYWEVTNHATEEQVARESYLQQLRDNERRHAGNSKSATVTSADLRAAGEATSPSRAKNLVEEETKEARSSLVSPFAFGSANARSSFGSFGSTAVSPPQKKYVMVRTLANGEKIKQAVDSNYPFLDRFKNNTTANKFEPSTKLLSTSSLVPTAGPRISSPVTSGGHKDIRSRVGAKVTTSEKKRIKIRQQQATKKIVKALERVRAKKATEEEEAKTMTLDESKAQQAGAKEDKPEFNVRKAGEGSDPKK